MCIGAVLIATFGAIGEPAHTLDQLLELLDRRSFILWMVGTASIVVIVLAGSRIAKTLSTPGHSRLSRVIKRHGPLISVNRGKLLRGLSFAFASGVLSAHTLLLAKSAVELLVRTIVDHVNQFNRWQSWMILVGMIALALTQLYYMHRGLKLCSTSVLYPFVFCIYNIIAILDGLIYFRQGSQLTGLHAGLIALGTVVLLGGVLCLSWRLEDIDSHTGLAIPSSTQTSLGPGMGIVEERPESSGDEEMQVGEQQPLLPSTPQRGTSHQRVSSLPLTSPYRYRAQTFTGQTLDTESAQIWAELDDSENVVAATDTDSLLSGPAYGPSFRPNRRPRAFSLLSGSHRGRRSHPRNDAGAGSISSTTTHGKFGDSPSSTLKTWDPRRFRNQRDGMSRRTSAPVTLDANRHPSPQQSWFRTLAASRVLRNYGTNGGGETAPTLTPESPREESSHAAADEGGFWRRGVRLLHRWTGPAGSNGDDRSSPV